MSGLIHIYTGDGKGKTTASVGLSVRFAGHGGKVCFGQFLKDGTSGEIAVLKSIPGISVYSNEEKFGFSFMMNDETKERAQKSYSEYLQYLLKQATEEQCGLLVLDEIISAYNLNFVDHDTLLQFLKHKPDNMEVVLTGRDPANELVQLADYVSDIRKVKHPFDRHIMARDGIEQ